MAVEQVAELQILAEHIEGFVPPEALELGGVDAAIHASGQRAALEAVAGEIEPSKAGRDGARLDDVGNRARRERRFANLGRSSQRFRRRQPLEWLRREARGASSVASLGCGPLVSISPRLAACRGLAPPPRRAPGARFAGIAGRL